MENRQSPQHCTTDIYSRFAIYLNGKEDAIEWDFPPALNFHAKWYQDSILNIQIWLHVWGKKQTTFRHATFHRL